MPCVLCIYALSRDAENLAREAEELITDTAPNIVQVCFQLRLSRPMPLST